MLSTSNRCSNRHMSVTVTLRNRKSGLHPRVGARECVRVCELCSRAGNEGYSYTLEGA